MDADDAGMPPTEITRAEEIAIDILSPRMATGGRGVPKEVREKVTVYVDGVVVPGVTSIVFDANEDMDPLVGRLMAAASIGWFRRAGLRLMRQQDFVEEFDGLVEQISQLRNAAKYLLAGNSPANKARMEETLATVEAVLHELGADVCPQMGCLEVGAHATHRYGDQ